MHDANGTPLQKGDIVSVEFELTELYGGDEYCNVGMQSVLGRRPDGLREHVSSVNTGVMVLKHRPANAAAADGPVAGDTA